MEVLHRPECWSVDGIYMGATPIPLRDVAPLTNFSEEARERIGLAVIGPKPPDEWLKFVGCQMRSRAFMEWFWYRGVDPDSRRKSIPKWMRDTVIERDAGICQLCGDPVADDDVHIDHITPVSLGGRNEINNLQVAHSTCNLRKGNRI